MRVAITGGIGEGKSTVLGLLAELGHATASSDAISRELFLKAEVNALLARAAGKELSISPQELRIALASSATVRREVNRIMHPLVVQAIDQGEARFVEVPLLIEACLQTRFDRVWVVTCGEREQRRRLLERYGDGALVDSMLAAQLPTRSKLPFADTIIRTNRSRDHVRRLLSEAVAGLSA